ncbi:MAG: hypothetical protein ACYTGG_08755 [Planctomycetota bacterium]|jgi:hypothetical protein
MAIRSLRQKLLRLGVFLLPVVVVKGLGSILAAPGPADVAAATIDPVVAEIVHSAPPTPNWSSDQLDAAARIVALRSEVFGSNPLFYEPSITSVDPTPAQTPNLTLDVRLQAIFSSPTSVTALINSRPYRVGETIKGTAWLVESIDSGARTAILRHEPSGTTRKLTVDRPN